MPCQWVMGLKAPVQTHSNNSSSNRTHSIIYQALSTSYAVITPLLWQAEPRPRSPGGILQANFGWRGVGKHRFNFTSTL